MAKKKRTRAQPLQPQPELGGMNARPLDETISQTGPGFPDDTSRPVEIDPEEEKALERAIRKRFRDKLAQRPLLGRMCAIRHTEGLNSRSAIHDADGTSDDC